MPCGASADAFRTLGVVKLSRKQQFLCRKSSLDPFADGLAMFNGFIGLALDPRCPTGAG